MSDPRDRWPRALTRLSALMVAATLLLLYGWIALEAAPLLLDPPPGIGLAHLFGPATPVGGEDGHRTAGRYVWQPVSPLPKYSTIPLLMGTVKVAAVAAALAVALGVPAAVFTSTLVPRRAGAILRTVIGFAGGVPTVVLGAVTLLDVAPRLAPVLGLGSPYSAAMAGLALGFWAAPAVYLASEEALRAAARTQLDLGLALGAGHWQAVRTVVIPAALPGLAAAALLGLAQVLGETMIVLMVSGNAAVATWDITASTRTVAATLAAEMGEVVRGSPHYRILFLLGGLLLLATSALNAAARLLQGRLRRTLAAVAPEREDEGT